MTMNYLEYDLQTKLDGARTARSEHCVRTDHVRGGRLETESRTTGTTRIGDTAFESPRSSRWIGNIRVVEYVEEFGAELSCDALSKPKDLRDGGIHVVVRHPAENVIARGAIASIC